MMVDFKFDAVYRYVFIKEPPEVGLVEKLSGSLYWWVELGVPSLHGECYRTLIGRAKRAPHWGVQSRFRVIYNWRASKASETPSIATYRKKCLGLSTSKPHCACSQFYVKRRSGRAGIYEKFVCC